MSGAELPVAEPAEAYRAFEWGVENSHEVEFNEFVVIFAVRESHLFNKLIKVNQRCERHSGKCPCLIL